MKIGLTLPNVGLHVGKKQIIETAALAEKLEFDSIWTSDHLLVGRDYSSTFGKALECLATLSFLAGKTEHVSLGTGALILPMREVVLVAKQISSIQIFSSNRLLLGVGAGWNETEFENVRAPSFHDRGIYFDESLQLLKWLLKGNAEFSGEFYKINDGVFGPTPRKQIPIYIAGSGGQSLRRAAKLGDGWFPNGISVEAFSKGKSNLLKLTARRMQFLLRMAVAFADKEKGLPSQAITSTGELHTRLAGTPSEIIAQIVRYKKAGLDHLVCYFGDRDPGTLKVKIDEFAKSVLHSL